MFGSITHRGGRNARVPVRAASRQLSAAPTDRLANVRVVVVLLLCCCRAVVVLLACCCCVDCGIHCR
ncbi:MAG: hypothetical protein LBQ66_14880 [Planctomycetaceae bacterium]|nr:hypothetical protein [Planctomycetaceae bacterium]